MPKIAPKKAPAKKAPAAAPVKGKAPGKAPPPPASSPAVNAAPAPVDMGQLAALAAQLGLTIAPAVNAAPAATVKAPKLGTPAATVAATPASSEAATLRAELASVRAELAQLSKAAARSKGPIVRSTEEILDGAPELGEDDWRAGYAGERRYTLGWERPDNRAGQPHAPITLTGGPVTHALLAVPRDNDGPHGAAARAAGLLAVYETQTEDGRWMPPVYVTESELGQIWDHDSNV